MDTSNNVNDPLEEVQEEKSEKKINISRIIDKIMKGRGKESLWRKRARKCVHLYRDDVRNEDGTTNYTTEGDDDLTPYNILWANVDTLLPALFSASPNPDVRSRFLSQDRDTQDAAQIIERCLSYSLDAYNFVRLTKSCIKDYLITGRGVQRVRLLPIFENVTTQDIDIDGNITQSSEEVLKGQSVRCELVHWDQFTIDPQKRWEDVTWIDFEHRLTEDEFEHYFPGKPLPGCPVKPGQYTTETLYEVHEFWDKNTKQVIFLGKGVDEPLKVLDDPLRLTHFWPMPEPLYSIQTNDSLVPIPEYTIYQAQANELNEITYRITDLVRACKFVGIYDSAQSSLSDVVSGRDSQMFPVQTNLMREGGMKSVIDSLDVSPMANVLAQLFHQRDQIKSIIYEVTGISDIIRGESKASETATAQNIKASYAGLRLRDRRDNINRYIVDLLRIKAELICQFFPIDQIEEMSGIMVTPGIANILDSDILRSYQIDIETDSTILMDMDQQAQKRASIVQSITQFIATTAPLVQSGALPLETAKALMKYALAPTKVSRQLEDALELIGQRTQMPPSQPMLGQEGIPMDRGGHEMNPQHPLMTRGVPQQSMVDAGGGQGLPTNGLGGDALRALLASQSVH